MIKVALYKIYFEIKENANGEQIHFLDHDIREITETHSKTSFLTLRQATQKGKQKGSEKAETARTTASSVERRATSLSPQKSVQLQTEES